MPEESRRDEIIREIIQLEKQVAQRAAFSRAMAAIAENVIPPKMEGLEIPCLSALVMSLNPEERLEQLRAKLRELDNSSKSAESTPEANLNGTATIAALLNEGKRKEAVELWQSHHGAAPKTELYGTRQVDGEPENLDKKDFYEWRRGDGNAGKVGSPTDVKVRRRLLRG